MALRVQSARLPKTERLLSVPGMGIPSRCTQHPHPSPNLGYKVTLLFTLSSSGGSLDALPLTQDTLAFMF